MGSEGGQDKQQPYGYPCGPVLAAEEGMHGTCFHRFLYSPQKHPAMGMGILRRSGEHQVSGYGAGTGN